MVTPQTRFLDWGEMYDVPFDGGFQRNLLLGDGPYFGIQISDYLSDPLPAHPDLFDYTTECNVGLASGETKRDTLMRLSTRSSVHNRPAPLPIKAAHSAFNRHRNGVVRALAEATLYRGKDKFVMWADEGQEKPERLARLAARWGMVMEMRGEYPVYVRKVALV